MGAATVLAPVFAQIALTFALLLWMGSARIRALRERRLHIRDVALSEPNWPPDIAKIQNAYQNQFELPVLFYTLVALALVTGHATVVLVVLSWVFVATRCVHAFIHATSNHVPWRFWAYCAGLLTLIVMWLWFLFVVVFA